MNSTQLYNEESNIFNTIYSLSVQSITAKSSNQLFDINQLSYLTSLSKNLNINDIKKGKEQ